MSDEINKDSLEESVETDENQSETIGETTCPNCGENKETCSVKEEEESEGEEKAQVEEGEVTVTDAEDSGNAREPEDEAELTIIGEARNYTLSEEVQILESLAGGTQWKVCLISPGVSKNKTYYSPSMLSKSTGLFEGAPCFADHDPDNPTNRSVREVVGWYDGVKYESGIGVTATFHALESQAWFTEMLKESYKRGKTNLFGFSINGVGSKRVGKIGGESVFVVEELQKIDSVDAVIRPSAGGRVLRLVASENNDKEELELIDKMTLEELKVQRPDLYETIVTNAVTESDTKMKELEAEMARIQEEAEAAKAKVTENEEDSTDEKKDALARLEEEFNAKMARIEEMTAKAEEKVRIAESKAVLTQKISESDLPDPIKRKLERKYDGKVFEESDLIADITDEKETLEKLFEDTPYSRTSDTTHVSMGMGQRERAVKALDGFWDNKPVDGVAPARSLLEAYAIFTGKSSWEIRPDLVVREAAVNYDSAGRISEALSGAVGTSPLYWGEIMGDSVTRRMVKEYNDLGYDEWRKFCTVNTVPDFRTQRRTRFGGYSTLQVVSELSAYPTLTSPTDEEATYNVEKRGGLETITMEMIARDDLAALRRVPFKLARAAKITLYRFVFNMISLSGSAGFVSTSYDTSVLFTTTHANALVSSNAMADATLNDANLTTARQLMAKQSAYNESTHILGIRPRYLIVPVDLDATAQRLVGNEFTYSGAVSGGQTDINVHRGTVETIVVPYWSDNTDGRNDRWVVVADPSEIPTIEVGFFQGSETPELFTQDSETVGSMFDIDKLTYKIRHIYGGTFLDHRGFVGSTNFKV